MNKTKDEWSWIGFDGVTKMIKWLSCWDEYQSKYKYKLKYKYKHWHSSSGGDDNWLWLSQVIKLLSSSERKPQAVVLKKTPEWFPKTTNPNEIFSLSGFFTETLNPNETCLPKMLNSQTQRPQDH